MCRWYEVPPSAAWEGDSWQQAFMPVEQIIEHNLGQLFGGAIITVRLPPPSLEAALVSWSDVS